MGIKQMEKNHQCCEQIKGLVVMQIRTPHTVNQAIGEYRQPMQNNQTIIITVGSNKTKQNKTKQNKTNKNYLKVVIKIFLVKLCIHSLKVKLFIELFVALSRLSKADKQSTI
jgi:hypothetical protein